MANELHAVIVSLAMECITGVHFHWATYLCQGFSIDCRDAQKGWKTFHYSWLIILIELIVWKELEDSQFPFVEMHVYEEARYASLWFTKKWFSLC